MRLKIFVSTVFLLLIFVNFLYVTSGIYHYGVASIDVYSIWAYKSKAMIATEGDLIEVLRSAEFHPFHRQYPPLLPLLFFYLQKIYSGVYRDWSFLSLYPIIYLSIVFFTFKNLQFLLKNTPKALILTYIFSMFSPLLAQAGREHAGSADIILTLIYSVYLFFFLRLPESSNKIMVITLTAASLASLVKMEGVFLAVFLLTARYRPVDKMIYFLASLVPLLVWVIFLKIFEVQFSLSYQLYGPLILLSRLAEVIFNTFVQMLNVRNWYIFWPVFFASLFTLKGLSSKRRIAAPLALMVLAFIGSYVFSQLDVTNYVSSSVDRIMLQLMPFIYLIFAQKVSSILPKIKP